MGRGSKKPSQADNTNAATPEIDSAEEVTDSVRLEAALRESAERFKLLFDQSPLPKWVYEAETLRFVHVNDAAIELYGYAREEFLRDLTMPKLCDTQTAAKSSGADLRPGEKQLTRHRTKSGEVIDVEIQSSGISLSGKLAFLVSARDVTESMRADEERSRLERELQERARQLEEANRNKIEFIAVLSHELRAPLNAICSWAELLRRPEIGAGELHKGLEIIARNGRIQAQLLSDLLDANRIATGMLSLEMIPVDLRREVKNAVEAALPATVAKRLDLELDGDPPQAMVLGDAARIQQILSNLLSNAIKHSPEGSQIRVSLEQCDGAAVIRVSDTGSGIPGGFLPHVFERFRSADRTKSGLGLGLAVSKELVEMHGGTIRAESAGKDQGTTFTVTLPLSFGDEAEPRTLREEPESASGRLDGRLILVVDDEADAREPVRRLLQSAGAEVIAVRSANEALEALQRQHPDVLVSDIDMPGRDGYDLMRSVRTLPADRGGNVPAIALTALGTPEHRERALSAGYLMHLVKPIHRVTLVDAIASLLPPSR